MPRNATRGRNAAGLTPRQQRVLEHLLAGETVTSAAKAGKVDRTTAHRWLREDYAFQAAYNRGRRELQEALQTRLLSLAEKAARTVEGAVEGGDSRAALAVLKGLGLLNGEPPEIGSDDPEDLEEEEQKQRFWENLGAGWAED